MALRSKVSAKNSERVPAWIKRRASERPAARWIAWEAKRPRAENEAEGRDIAEAQRTADPPRTATIIYIAQWKAARRR